jgi:cytosine permease
VIKQTLVGVTLGEYTVGLIGVLLAHAVKSEDVVRIVTTEVGVVGAAVLVTATLKINDWNLYSASLGLVNVIDQAVGRRVDRSAVTLAVGAVGTALSVAGILERFIGFLTVLGIAFPPIAGIMIADYYVVRRHRAALDRSRLAGTLPAQEEAINPRMLLAWAAGYVVRAGIPALNALLCSFIVYIASMRKGRSLPSTGGQCTDQVEAPNNLFGAERVDHDCRRPPRPGSLPSSSDARFNP